MRLTLRTLLAYMDDILEPADHEDLGGKIEASDFATELIHRSRDTVRRLRLGAPAVLSDGSDDVLDTLDLGDANSVAEYLDNTLPPEQVADFERMCLEPGTESDMHLAEVASCHHVLTMVLGEPAEVDADLKSRMYQLPARLASGQKLRIEPAHAPPLAAPPVQASAPVASPSAGVVAQPTSVSSHHEVPDYLREATASKRHSRRMAIVTTFLAIGAVVIFWFVTAPEAQLSEELVMSGADQYDTSEASVDIDLEDLGNATGNAHVVEEDSMSTAPAFVHNDSTTKALADVPSKPTATDEPTRSAPLILPADESSPPAKVAPSAVKPAIEIAKEIADPKSPAVAVASVPSVVETEIPDGPETMADTATEEPILVAAATSPAITEGATASTEAAHAEDPILPVPAGPERLGNYLGTNDLLLIHNNSQNKWVRLPPRSAISTGDVLMTLPHFLTHVVLADVNTYLSGGTRLRIPLEKFDASSNDSDLTLEIIYGRLMLNAGLKGSQLAIQIDDQRREFHLLGSASLAVDVEREFVPGSDYENEAASIKATWYLTSGSVQWPTAAGGTQTVQAPSVWETIDGIDEIPEQLDKLPAWIGDDQLTGMQRSAREDLAQELETGRPVGIRLLELTEGKGLGRRKEVRMLAAASSVYVGEIEPLILALNDSGQSRAWDSLIKSLRQAIALSPDDAKRVRQAFVNIRGDEAAQDLMEMVFGYNRQQIGESREAIQNGAVAQLLKWLDHDSLDYRVLAIHNIQEIAHKAKGYRPADSSKNRKIRLRKLLDEFKNGELVP